MIIKYVCENCHQERLYILCTNCHKTKIPVPAKDDPTVCPRCYVLLQKNRPEHDPQCLANMKLLQEGQFVQKLCVCPLNSI